MKFIYTLLLSAVMAAGGGITADATATSPMPKARHAGSIKGWQNIASVPTKATFTKNISKHTGLLRAPEAASDVFIPEIHGNVLYPQNSPAYLTMSVLPDREGGSFTSLSPYGLTANGGGALVGDVYYAGLYIEQEGFEEYMMFAFDGNTWNQLWVENVGIGLMATDVAVDPTSGKVYGCFYNDGDYENGAVFGIIDYSTLTRKPISNLATSWSACAFDAEGQLYAIDYYGALLKVDKTTGEQTIVGDTELMSPYITSGAIDPHTGKFYYAHAADDDTGYLYEIDTKTAVATLLYQFPNNEEIVGMYVAAPKTAYDAPAVVKDAALNFAGASLTGSVAFTAPTMLYDGTPAEGALSYTIKANDAEVAKGETSYGASVSAQVTLPADGKYTLAITTTNSKGESAPVELTAYIGNDTPVAPAVTARYSAGEVTVSWGAVTKGVNGGYVDAAAVTYNVTRMPGNVSVAANIAATTAVDVVDSPEEQVIYTYVVTAQAAGKVSAPGESNTVAFGPITPPYKEDFSSADSFSTLTIIDANNDGKTWYRFTGVHNPTGGARIVYNSKMAMDDWLITPPLRLDAGKIYVMRFDVFKEGDNANLKERIEVKCGKGNTAADMTTVVLNPTLVVDKNPTTLTCTLEPTESGIYYVGFHGCSDKDVYYLNLDNIEIEAGAIANAPDMVDNLVVTPGSYGRHQAEIACNAPVKSFNGNAIAELTKVEIKRDGEVIHTVEAPAPGQLILYTDTSVGAGEHTYSVTAHNQAGEGKPSYATVYIGTKTPVAPKSVSVSEPAPGQVKVSWIAPDKDVEGNLIDPSVLVYHVAQILGDKVTTVAEGVSGNSITYTPEIPQGEQDFVTYGVFALSEGGLSEPAISDATPVGTPYAMPYKESFGNASLSSLFAVETEVGDGSWGLLRDNFSDLINAADGDNGYASFSGTTIEDRASLISGKVDLAGAAQPTLEFQLFNMQGSEPNPNTVEVYANDGSGYSSLATVVLKETGAANEWNPVTIDLLSLKDKAPWFKFTATLNLYAYIMLDAINVFDKMSGIEAADAAAPSAAVVITANNGVINIAGAEGEAVMVASADGRVLYSTSAAAGTLAIEATPGIYLVKAAGTVAKILLH